MFYIYADGNQIYRPLDDLLVLFSPRLTLEIGKAGALEFDIPPVNPYYSNLNQLTTEVTVEMDSEEIFHGRVLSNERQFNNIRHVYCEGDLSYLVDSVQKGVKYSGTTHALFNQIIANHNARVNAAKRFTVGTVNIEDRSIILVGQSESENLNTGTVDYKQIAIDSIVDNWNNTFDYIQTCLIDYCGGYLRTRRVNGITYIDLLSDFGNSAPQAIQLGANLLDLTEKISAEDVFTVLIPLGDDNLTIASANGGSDELVDTDAVSKYGRIVKTHVFNNVSSASTLLENARRFLATSVNIPRTITVRAVDLHLLNPVIQPIHIGDKVTIDSVVHDMDDILTCTKIEYDLERPENNSYTFGNPQQTLTQRYREDIRLSNDTYGNSASSANVSSASSPTAASAKGASAAAAAAKTADKEKDKALDRFFDAWIDVKPEQGTVKLGALHRDYINGKEVLLSECGIDLDGATGNVNIKSMKNVVDDHGHLIAENDAYIKMVEEKDAVAIQSVTERHDHLAQVEAEHYTAINQRADTLGSSIDLVARDLNSFEDTTNTAITNINMIADDHESRITANASYVSSVDSRESSHYASIEIWANETESAIALKADKVTIDNLMTGRTTADALRATDIKAGSISIWAEGGAQPVATLSHSHTIAAIEQSGGTIQINIGSGSTTIPQSTTFNIANTKFYKDGVAAVKLESLSYYTIAGEQTVTYNATTKTISASVQATLSNGNTNGSIRTVTGIPATEAYNAGVDSVTIKQVGGSAGTATYQSGMTRYVVPVTVSARASNGAYGTDSINIYVSASDAYNAGYYAGQAASSGYTNIYYNITDQQTSSKIKITVVVYGYNGSYYEAVASGVHEYAK